MYEEITIRSAVEEPTGSNLDRAIATLRNLADRAYRHQDWEAYRNLQPALFDLHMRTEPETHWVRQFLASQVYDIEAERVMIPVDANSDSDVEMLEPDELRRRIWEQQHALTPVRHPFFLRLFADAGRIEVEAYLRQQWLILQYFWTQFLELGAQLERIGTSIEHLTPVFQNVWDELGEGDPATSHVVRHRMRQQTLGLDVDHHSPPDYPESMDYINTRLRFMRAENPAYALGSIFSQEATAQSYGKLHHDMLVRVGIGGFHGELYALHSVADVEHADEVLALAQELATCRGDQERFLAGHRAQMLVWRSHFDRIDGVIRVMDGQLRASPSHGQQRLVPNLSAEDHRSAATRAAPVEMADR